MNEEEIAAKMVLIQEKGYWVPDEEDPKSLTIAALHEKHKGSSPWLECVRPDSETRKSMVQQYPSGTLFQLIVDVQMIMFRAGVDNQSELYFSLYDADFDRWLTEEYCARITPNGFPVNGKPESLKCLFKNLKKAELEGNVHMVVRVVRYGDMQLGEGVNATSSKKKETRPKYRRPYAMAVMSLREQRESLLKSLHEGVAQKPDPVMIFCPDDEKKYPELHKLIINNQTRDYKAPPLSNGVALEIGLYAGDVETVRNNYAHFDLLTHLDHLTPQIVDDTHRNLMFLNINHANIQSRWNKTAPQNIEVRVELRRNSDMQSIRDRLQIGKGHMANRESMLYSMVYYHFNEPTFNERMTIHLPEAIQDLEECHLFLSFAHCRTSAKKRDDPIAFAFIKLFEPKTAQIIPSGQDQELEVWKFKSSINYLDNPNSLQATSHKCSIRLDLCSTRVAADPEIHKFLSWKIYPPEAMINCVRGLAKKPIDSLTAIFREVLDALFGILARNTHEKLSETCYEVLVSILSDVCKASQKQVTPVLSAWIDEHFACPDVWRTLLFHFLKSIHWASSNDAAKEKELTKIEQTQRAQKFRVLSNSMRGSKYLFKIIEKSYVIRPDTKQFKAMLNKVFNAIFRMMGLKRPKIIVGLQGFTLQNFLDFIQCLPDHTSTDLVNIVMHFLKSVRHADNNKKKIAAIDKLMLIKNFLDLPDIQTRDVVKRALPVIVDVLKSHMDSDKPAEEEAIACVYIMKSCTRFLMQEKGAKRPPPPPPGVRTSIRGSVSSVSPTEEILESFVELLLKLFNIFSKLRDTKIRELTLVNKIVGRKFRSKTTTMNGSDYEVQQIYRDVFCTMAELARAIMSKDGTWTKTNLSNKHNRVDHVLMRLREKDSVKFEKTVNSVLATCVGILKDSLFPQNWVEMRFAEAELCLRAFSWFDNVLNDYYVANFNKDMWVPYIQLGMRFLSEPTFDLENMADNRKQLINMTYGDLRQGALKQLRYIWDLLRKMHHVLAKELVGDAVDAGRSTIEEACRLSVDMFFDMMRSEFEQNKSIREVEHQTIDEVDNLTTRFYEDPTALAGYEKFFKQLLRAKLGEASPDMRQICAVFLDDVEELFSLLVKLKQLPSTKENEDERSAKMYELIQYLKRTQKDELFQRYLYEMGLLQQELKNHAEAGNCFVRYADILDWNDRTLKAYKTIPDSKSLPSQSETQRKIDMYEKAGRMYLQGEMFEKSIEVTKQLTYVYENVLFDLSKLADALQKQSTQWRLVANHDRVFLACYLVVYYGNFPDELKGKSFVYRSGVDSKIENIKDFTDRIKSKFPDSTVKNSGNPVPDEYKDPGFEGQFIRITTLQVSSQEELQGEEDVWSIGNKKRAPLRVKKYFRNNHIDTFFYTFVHKDKKVKGENEFRSIWVTKTFVTCEDTIPSVRRRVPVKKLTQQLITPLQNAVNSISDKNVHVAGVVDTVHNDLQHNVSDLSMNLNGIIDAAVMGGITKYREAFFDGVYFASHPDEVPLGRQFKEALAEQLRVVESGMACFDEYCPESLTPLKEHLEEKAAEMQKDLTVFINEEVES